MCIVSVCVCVCVCECVSVCVLCFGMHGNIKWKSLMISDICLMNDILGMIRTMKRKQDWDWLEELESVKNQFFILSLQLFNRVASRTQDKVWWQLMDSAVISSAAPQPDTFPPTSPCCSGRSRTMQGLSPWLHATRTSRRACRLRCLHLHPWCRPLPRPTIWSALTTSVSSQPGFSSAPWSGVETFPDILSFKWPIRLHFCVNPGPNFLCWMRHSVTCRSMLPLSWQRPDFTQSAPWRPSVL